MASLDPGGPIEFLIPGSGDDYLDLANTMLHVQVKVTRANGDDLDLADPVGPVNNWLHSLFGQVDVYLNGTLVTPSTNTYAYRAYIETLLSYGPDAKDTQLTSQLWYKDTATHMDAVEIVEGHAANEGFVTRRANIVRSRMVDHVVDRFCTHGWWEQPRVQDKHRQCHLVCKEGHPESDRADGAHQGSREGHGQVSDAVRRLQGVLHSRRCSVAHAREPVPRHSAETSVLLDRQDVAGRGERTDSQRLPTRLHLIRFLPDPRPVRRPLLPSGTKGQPAHRTAFPRRAAEHRERHCLRRTLIGA